MSLLDVKKKRLCRYKVEYWSKFWTWIIVVVVSLVFEYYGASTFLKMSIPITLWFWLPNIIAYILESYYHLEHKHDTYR